MKRNSLWRFALWEPLLRNTLQRNQSVVFSLLLAATLTACGETGGGQGLGSQQLALAQQADTSIESDEVKTSDKSDATSTPAKDKADRLFIALPALPTGSLSHHTLSSTGAGLIVVGGVKENGVTSNEILIFDEHLARFVSLPVTLSEARQQHTAMAIAGRDGIVGTKDDAVVVFGGCQHRTTGSGSVQLLRTVEVVVPDANGDGFYDDAYVQQLEPLRYELAGHCTENLYAKTDKTTQEFLIVGGVTPGATQYQEPVPTNEAWIYQITANEFGEFTGQIIEINQPAFARQYHTLTAMPGGDQAFGTADDYYLVFGGRGFEVLDSNNQAFTDRGIGTEAHAISTAEMYEPLSGRWRQVIIDGPLDLLSGRYRHRAVLGPEGLLIVGGINDESQTQRDVLRIEPDDLRADLFRALSVGRLNRGRELPEILPLAGQKLLIVGGFERSRSSKTGVVLDSAEVYDPNSQPTFTLLPQRMGRPRVYHQIAPLDGRIIVVGGYHNQAQHQAPDAEFMTRLPGASQ